MQDTVQAIRPDSEPVGAHVALDAGQAIRMAGGDVAFAQELLQLYLTGLPRRLAKLHHAYEAEDLEGIARAAHSLGSTSCTLGVITIGKLARIIEDEAWSGSLTGAREPLQPLLRAVDTFKTVVMDFDWTTLIP